MLKAQRRKMSQLQGKKEGEESKILK